MWFLTQCYTEVLQLRQFPPPVLQSSYSVAVTRSSAVAERPRDASCLSVVSFNSQLLLVTPALHLPIRTIELRSAVFDVTSRFLVINTSSSVSRYYCYTSDKCHSLASLLLITYDGEKVLTICLFVSTEYTKVADGQTNGQTDGHHVTAQTALMHSIAR